ncbi:FHA domain-containing protein [Micromonospora sp. CPCC 205371]|nr:FHA domain-containing protein [Micromonospora sp. CPCC 205371]
MTSEWLRISHRERQDAVRVLRDGARDGRLSEVTFVSRLRMALEARRRSELKAVVSDLPARGLLARARMLLGRATRSLSRPAAAAAVPEMELRLPPAPGSYVIGRDNGCDLRLADDTVSRRHAVLTVTDGQWTLSDLGSTNGSRINGWKLQAPSPVRPGDVVDLGSQRLRIVA